MKTSLEHLPEFKIQELKVLKDVIVEELDAQLIILYGSYARGTWVEDIYTEGHITYEYKSDFDILVITEPNKTSKAYPKWDGLQRKVNNLGNTTRASLIRHSINFVNSKIQKGSYFFNDILKEGILLFDSGKYQLAEPKELSFLERKEVAQEDFDMWFESANRFFETFEFNLGKGYWNIAAFQLHQATERYYMAILLVFTGYKPKLHDIEDLGQQAGSLNKEFFTVFPIGTEEEKRLFELLKNAYIDARYKKEYQISKEELKYLASRVEKLKTLTERICKEKINSF